MEGMHGKKISHTHEYDDCFEPLLWSVPSWQQQFPLQSRNMRAELMCAQVLPGEANIRLHFFGANGRPSRDILPPCLWIDGVGGMTDFGYSSVLKNECLLIDA